MRTKEFRVVKSAVVGDPLRKEGGKRIKKESKGGRKEVKEEERKVENEERKYSGTSV